MRRSHAVAFGAAVLFVLLGTDTVADALFGASDQAVNDVTSAWDERTLHAWDLASDVMVYGVAAALCIVAIIEVARMRDLAKGAGIALLLLAMAANNAVLKPWFARARPPTAWSDSFAFPSGHTTAALLVASALLVPRITPLRLAMVAAVSLLAGVFRILGGAHWVSDVLGSFAYGVVVAALVLGNGRVMAPVAGRIP